MTKKKLSILQVTAGIGRGGASRHVWSLHKSYQARGLNSWVAVGNYPEDADPHLLPIKPTEPQRSLNRIIFYTLRRLYQLSSRIPKIKGVNPAGIFYKLSVLPHILNQRYGLEDFQWGGTRTLLQLSPEHPDILHFTNMHGNYLDLRQLPYLSRQIPTLLGLPDTWAFTGHCAHFFDCFRWRTGCGNCPDLAIPPALQRDGTAFNYRRKQKIYRKSRYYVVVPSQWLLDNAQQSILAEGALDFRLIQHGIDLDIFTPANKAQVREQLGLPQDAIILLYTSAVRLKDNPFKDYTTILTAIEHVKQGMPDQKIHFIGVGDKPSIERRGNLTLQFVPYQADHRDLAQYYRATDIFLHAARAESAGLTIQEAQACGTPVIATAVGGIPGQLVDGHTGYLVPGGDGAAMAAQIQKMITSPGQLEVFSTQAADYARQHFGLERMVDEYLALYQEMIEDFNSKK